MGAYKILIYDGSFEGLMCCIYTIYNQKIQIYRIIKAGETIDELFADTITVETNIEQAQRVWSGIKRKSSNISLVRIELAYLSEIRGEDHTIVRYVQYLLDSKKNIEENISHPVVQRLVDVVNMVQREKLNIREKIRFQKLNDDMEYCILEPTYNILYLLKPYLIQKYPKKKWVIVDIRRNTALYYNQRETQTISLDLPKKQAKENVFKDEEIVYEHLTRQFNQFGQRPTIY